MDAADPAVQEYLQVRMLTPGPPWQLDPQHMGVSPAWQQIIAQFRERANVGEEAPDFTGDLLDGGPLRLSDFRGKQNALILFGSYTDPPLRSSLQLARPSLADLYREHSKSVEFVWVYGREAHPGALIPQHASMEDKLRNARRLRDEEQVPFPIVVDSLDGAIHRLYGPAFNNAIFLVNKAGFVVYRSIFLDTSELVEPLRDVTEWEWMDLHDRKIKKSYSERIRMCREPYDPLCQRKVISVLDANAGPQDWDKVLEQRGYDVRTWKLKEVEG